MMKNIYKIFVPMVLIAVLTGCGTEPRNTISMQIAGSDLEFSLKNTVCEASYIGGSQGNSPVICSGRFGATNSLSDGLRVDIFDAFYVDQNLNKNIPFHPSTVMPTVTLDGIDRGVLDGYARFSQISNFAGGRVCFQFFIILTNATMQGNLCQNIAVGGYGF